MSESLFYMLFDPSNAYYISRAVCETGLSFPVECVNPLAPRAASINHLSLGTAQTNKHTSRSP